MFDCAKKLRSSSDTLTEPTTSFGSPIFRIHPQGYNFFVKFNPYGIGSASENFVSFLFTFFPGDFDNLQQWQFPRRMHIGIRDQFDLLNIWEETIHPDDRNPASRRPTISSKEGLSAVNINNFIPHSKPLNGAESFLVEGTSYLEKRFSDAL